MIFLDRGLLLTRKLLNQGFLVAKVKPSVLSFIKDIEKKTIVNKTLHRKFKIEQ
jgi:hypothetical protein